MNRKMLAALPAALFLAASNGALAAGPSKAGCNGESAQFDFWIGRWKVMANGKLAGTSHIERILGGCALLENWTGTGGSAGKSLNFFDRADGLWHQTWIDATGGALFLAGKFENGVMRLAAEQPANAQQPATQQRITWTLLPGGKVRQLWVSRKADETEWTVQFDGLYEPQATAPAKEP